MLWSIGKGFILGSIVWILSILGDYTISKNNTRILKNEDYELYYLANNSLFVNMLIVSPILYSFIDMYLIDHSISSFTFQPLSIAVILLVQNAGYYLVHRLFHKSSLYRFHSFHHKFDKRLIPSLGNAVSVEEFVFAYMIPFIMGAYITYPSELSMIIPLFLVATLNMSIHCQELTHIKYPGFIVSPEEHFIHHKKRNRHFAAPFLNIDKVVE